MGCIEERVKKAFWQDVSRKGAGTTGDFTVMRTKLVMQYFISHRFI